MPSPARQPPARDSGSGAGDARPRTRPHAPLAARGLSWSTAIHLGERRRPGTTASTGLMHHQGGRPAVALFTPSGGDGIEREARASAAGATSPAPARMRARVPRTALQRAAHHAAARTAPAIIAAKPAPAPGPGEPLPVSVAGPVSESFGVDLSRVRVHTTAAAAQAADALGARAFAYGSHVFLGRGERPTDLRLMAHELAHVVQQGGTATLQRWSTSGGDSHEHEAHRAAAAVGRRPFAVRERTPPRIQRLGIRDALDYFAGKANLIPGFRMFTIVLGVNPINMSGVDRSAANILRAVVELIPGGGLIVQALESNGVFDRVGSWVEQQISTLGLSGGSIRRAIDDFLGTLSLSDIFDLGGVWERAKRIFTEPIRRIIDFAGGLVSAIVKFIKDAILMPLAKLAEKTRGWDLLIAVLGRNPITGEPVPRNAETLIGGFMKLIGQEEIWENLKKSGAVARAWAWFQGAMEALLGFVGQIPALAIAAFESLELSDLILLPRAFAKVGAVFGTFLGKFFDWAGNAIWNLLEIIFDVVSPGALGYVKRTGAALKSIFKNPLPFVGNLVRAAKAGFQNFASNIGTHLKAGLIDWLTGSLPGVYIPKAFSIGEVVKFVFSVLGISWANVRAKLVKVVPGGETTVKILEKGFDIVVTLVTQGPAAAWEQIKGELSKLKDMVISGITDFVIDTVVKKAVPKLIALFIPGAGFISAILSIYDTVMVFVQKISKIIQVVTGFIDSIGTIASGDISAASKRVESVLAGLLSLAINFLAGFVGLGKVADKVMGVIGKVRDAVDKALDRVVDWIVATAKRLGKLVTDAAAGLTQWWRAKASFGDRSGRNHRLFFAGEGDGARLKVASSEMFTEEFIAKVEAAMASDPVSRSLGTAPLSSCRAERAKIDRAKAELQKAQVRRDEFLAKNYERQVKAAVDAMAAPMSILIDLLPENRDTTLPVQPGKFVTIPYKNTARKGEILIVSNLNIRYKVDAVAAVLQIPTAEFKARWGSDIFEYVEGSLRDRYLGATPGKASATGRQVVARYRQRTVSGVVEVEWKPNTWHPLLDCDMSHAPVDAVDYWNNTGKGTGPRSDTVRAWMNNPVNYILEPASINRSRGSANNSRYQPPTA